MVKKKRRIGIEHIYVSDVLETGLMETLSNMSEIGEIVPDSVTNPKEEDTITDLKNQETGDVDMSITSEVGAESVTFTTRNMNQENQIRAFGGSMVAGKWEAPVDANRGRDLSVKIISRAVDGLHSVTDYPKTKMTATNVAELTESESSGIIYTMKKLTPVDESTGIKQSPKQQYFQPQAPAFGVVSDATNEFLFDLVPTFDTVTEYEYSEDGGTVWADVTVNPIVVTPPVAIGDLLVRVKQVITGDDQFVSGFALANTEAFTV
jgi:hypothetical protein